jgi:hypothetical protein
VLGDTFGFLHFVRVLRCRGARNGKKVRSAVREKVGDERRGPFKQADGHEVGKTFNPRNDSSTTPVATSFGIVRDTFDLDRVRDSTTSCDRQGRHPYQTRPRTKLRPRLPIDLVGSHLMG